MRCLFPFGGDYGDIEEGPPDEVVTYVFDRPIDPPGQDWYFGPNAPDRHDLPPHPEILIAEAFENSGALLSRFSDAQVGQGLWYLGSDSCSAYMDALLDPLIPLERRLRALRSFVPLFEQVMAVRCSQHLSRLDEKGANPLNVACYMWWDNLPFRFRERELLSAGFGEEIVLILRRQLALPHDARRESALHGIGHLVKSYPQLAGVVDEFLASTDGLRPELVAYAQRARAGNVL
jgi:hypothetical protein